jgi:hypothetical protein
VDDVVRLIALVSWFDEQPAWLAELVASLARCGVDHVVAVDGAYALYPQARGSSGSEQAHVVASSAAGAGIGCTVHVPRDRWLGNETEKRSFMFRLGHALATPGDDWLVVADADEVWEPAGSLRSELEAASGDVGEVLLYEQDRVTGAGVTSTMIRKCFRAQPSPVRVVGHHARYECADRVLWDAARPAAQEPSAWLSDVKVRHRPTERAAYRTDRRNAYYGLRSSVNLEFAA